MATMVLNLKLKGMSATTLIFLQNLTTPSFRLTYNKI